jgi:hypothetical protein
VKENDEQARNKVSPSFNKHVVLSTLASFLTQGETDERFEIFLHPTDPAPALVCFYNLKAFRCHYRNLWLFVKAFGEVCRELKAEFDPTSVDVKSWEKFQKERPDIAEKAYLLALDPDFLRSFTEEAETFADQYMQFIDSVAIMRGVRVGTEWLTAQAKENLLTAMYESAGLERRRAGSKHRSGGRIIRQANREQMNLKNGRNGVKSNAPKVNYNKLKEAVCDLEDNTIPDKKDVATKMGFRGENRSETLGNWMRSHRDLLMQTHNHTTHKYRQVAKEILDRENSKPV